MSDDARSETGEIVSPMPLGSGAIVVHRLLAQAIAGYRVVPYNPWWTLVPPALRRFRPSRARLVHTAADYGALLAPAGVPLVATFHNYVLDPGLRRYSSWAQALHYRTDLRWYTRRSLRRAAVVTAVSTATAELVREDLGFGGEIVVIPNGVDATRFSPAPQAQERDTVRVLFAGNPSQRKGFQWLPDIAQRLDPNVELWCATGLAGSRASQAHPRLRMLGPQPHGRMPDLYRSVDILLLPSVREGMSLAALEAMASGLPLVATDVGSMPELVADGEGGYLCPLGDGAAFAERINLLARAPGERRRMGQRNRERTLAMFTEERMVQGYRDAFARVPGAQATGAQDSASARSNRT